ncbi:hypothetical protein BZM27_12595 [Paraburkholderia steynii]|uniref:Uncharacterized protein n=1 Tax=Paraburkholderia steynii TaxID=1245441 RepID=A0A4R0XLP9_9BURK|nr:hypothetical protein BZM27_12595 [Paraburkholderia steynii]
MMRGFIIIRASRLEQIFNQLGAIMSALDDLKAEVAATISIEQSAVTLIQGIAQQLQDALANAGVNDPALTDLTTQLKANADALAAAVSANTPAAPPAEEPQT